MKNITVLTIIFTFCFPFLNFAQSHNIRFGHLTTDDGLSHSNVMCILQDHQGFMWFGSFDGLNKYDGYNFTTYRHSHDDNKSIMSNSIRSFYEDQEGNIWIATMLGLSQYDKQKDHFINYTTDNGYNLENYDSWNVFRDSRGNVWIGTRGKGLILFDPVKNYSIHFQNDENDSTSISHNRTRQVFEDSKGNLWVATEHGLNLYNYSKQSFTRYFNQGKNPNSLIGNTIYFIYEDSKGYLWFGCYGNGLSYIHVNDIDKQLFKHFQHNPENSNSISSNRILALCEDKKGGFWIGYEDSGLDYLHKDKKTFFHYKNNKNDPYSLNSNSIYSLYKDNVGNIWIGTFDGGINLINYTGQGFIHYKNIPGQSNILSHNSVWEFSEDNQGNIWIATDGGGLNKFNTKNGNFEHYNSKNSNLNSDAVLTVFIDSQNDVWIGTWAGGISKFNKQTKTFVTFLNGNINSYNNNIFDIVEDENGNLWLATQGGLNSFNKETKSFVNYNKNNSTLIDNFLEVVKLDHEGNLLLGSSISFMIFNPKTEGIINLTFNQGNLKTHFITSILEENDTTIWIGTTNGLNKLNKNTASITKYLTSDGLPNDLIFGIEKDDKGFLWISTNGGISRFDPKTENFKNYTKEDGLQGNTFIKKSHYKSKDGRMYFGGNNGFNVFHPDSIKKNTHVPPVVITNFLIFNKPVKIGEKKSPLKSHINLTEEITLSYKHSVFSFEFAALNYLIPKKNQYAYKMEGFEKEWNYVGNKREATYTNLDPGKYIFRVKGSNNDGLWNEEGTSLKIIITPPFWKTIWFRISMMILIILAVYSIHFVRVRNIVAYGRELEIKVAKRTEDLKNANEELKDFAYIISHDLKAPLRGINELSDWISEDYANILDKEGKENLKMLRERTARMNDMIQGILQYSRVGRTEGEAEEVDLNELLEEVIDLLAPPDNIKITVENKLPEYTADRTRLTQIFENLLSNAIKYIDKPKGIIKIGCTEKENEWEFSVTDNGPGIEKKHFEKIFKIFQTLESKKTDENTGIGLTIIKKIIDLYKGRLWLESKIGKGTTFYFTLPKQ